MIWELIFAPFADFGFMRRALLGCIAVSVGATPVGVFLMLRHMSLTGDAMAHAILPGAAIGYLVSGLSLGAMTIGGVRFCCARYGAERGCEPCCVLSDLLGARRSDRVHARQ